MMTEAKAIPTGAAIARRFVDYSCPLCGMFLLSTDAALGARTRVRCTSKRCKGKVREIVVM